VSIRKARYPIADVEARKHLARAPCLSDEEIKKRKLPEKRGFCKAQYKYYRGKIYLVTPMFHKHKKSMQNIIRYGEVATL